MLESSFWACDLKKLCAHPFFGAAGLPVAVFCRTEGSRACLAVESVVLQFVSPPSPLTGAGVVLSDDWHSRSPADMGLIKV